MRLFKNYSSYIPLMSKIDNKLISLHQEAADKY